MENTDFNITFDLDSPVAEQTDELDAAVTGFRPDRDGWSFANGLVFNPLGYDWTTRGTDGRCLGFAATALYYYTHPFLPNTLTRTVSNQISIAQARGNSWSQSQDGPITNTMSEVAANSYETQLLQFKLHSLQPSIIGVSPARGVSGDGHAVVAVAAFTSRSLIDASAANFGASNIDEVDNVTDFSFPGMVFERIKNARP